MRTFTYHFVSDLQRCDDLLTRDRRESIEKLLDAVISFQIVDQIPQRHPGTNEDGRTAKDFWIAMYCNGCR